jgi:hypothetical protein
LAAQNGTPTPQERAIAYLGREVPAWSRENHCYSCHNNGDGARALYLARQLRLGVPRQALDGTNAWLARPEGWDEAAKNPAASDLKLARIQFTAALASAVETGAIEDRAALVRAARMLLGDQDADGSFRVDTGSAPGSPITWGTTLATTLARRSLMTAGSDQFAEAIALAERWLRESKPESLLDAAVLLLAVPDHQTVERRDALISAQTSDGGWGPQRGAPAEPFDTAIVLLALRGLDQAQRPRAAIERGRRFLIARQLETGGWPETTRPAGGQSYAHHVSTSAWATMALLATDAK